jgi:uncharacterized membrane protein HdeD (DUF308 family)
MRSHADPATDYASALAKLAKLQGLDDDDAKPVNSVCRTGLLTHGSRTTRVAVLIHGLTNCPAQYVQFAPLLFARGYNVLTPRMPHNGLVDRNTQDLKLTTPEELRAFSDAIVDIACGLGEQITVMGLSGGGSLACWIAQFRPDVDLVVPVAPLLGFLPNLPLLGRRSNRVATSALHLLPNVMTQSIFSYKGGPAHGYYGFATHGLAAYMLLGDAVYTAACRTAPAAQRVVVVVNGNDTAVNNAVIRDLARRWQTTSPERVSTYDFAKSLGLIHDVIDPQQKRQQTAFVYPILLGLITGDTATPPGEPSGDGTGATAAATRDATPEASDVAEAAGVPSDPDGPSQTGDASQASEVDQGGGSRAAENASGPGASSSNAMQIASASPAPANQTSGAHEGGGINAWLEHNLWVLDVVRGVGSIVVGAAWLFAWAFGQFILFIGLGTYLLIDGLFDVVSSWVAGRHHHVAHTHYLTGTLSIVIGGVVIVFQQLALLLLLLYAGVRAVLHGIVDIWRSVSSLWRRRDVHHARAPGAPGERFLWLGGVAKVLIGVALVVLSPLALVIFTLYLGIYFVVDGCVFFYSALLKSGLLGHKTYLGSSTMAPPDALVPVVDADDPAARRAIAFVRRNGAAGMGHAAWAFEWETGWFNCGSVENPTSAAFAPPEKMGFWTAHTQEPVATMQEQPTPYDEYKVLFVAQPQPKTAWQTVIWVSRQGYSLARRNCADAAYDVLRSYGAAHLADTSQKSLPNEWYDALPGPSYCIAEHPLIPPRPDEAPRLAKLPTKEIHLHIPERFDAEAPSWRAGGGRARYELTNRFEYMNEEVLVAINGVVHLLTNPLRTYLERRAPHEVSTAVESTVAEVETHIGTQGGKQEIIQRDTPPASSSDTRPDIRPDVQRGA